MTNKELQELLKRYPDDAKVVFDGALFEYVIRKVHYYRHLKKIKLGD